MFSGTMGTGVVFQVHMSHQNPSEMGSRFDYLRSTPLWEVHRGCRYAHIAGRAPCGPKGKVMLYNIDAVLLSSGRGFR